MALKMAPVKFGIGQSVRRKEDDPLIRGKGHYTDDHSPGATLHALMLRSPHAHASYKIDTSAARSLPGVSLILTAADVADLGGFPCLFNLPDNPFTAPPYPIISKDVVRHVGDAVAFVVADTLAHARDALEAIKVDWSPMPAAIGVVNAVKSGAAQVWPQFANNVLFDVPLGDKKATDAVFAKSLGGWICDRHSPRLELVCPAGARTDRKAAGRGWPSGPCSLQRIG